MQPDTTGEASAHVRLFTAVDEGRPFWTQRRAFGPRRLLSVPVGFLAFPVLVLTTPIWLPVALVADVVTAPRRFPATRIMLATAGYAWWTLKAQMLIAIVWVASGFGARNWGDTTQERWRRMTGWWVDGNLRWFRRSIGLDFHVDRLADLQSGPLIVFARHESIFDAFLAPGLATRGTDMFVRLVMTRELRLEPNLDLVAHRAPHHFVERGGADPTVEADAVGELARDLAEDIAVIIFPEGRLSRPEVRARVIQRLRENEDDRGARRAEELAHLLPIRPGGALALLQNAPSGSEIAFVGHVGYVGLTDPRTVWRNVPLRRPIEVTIRRYSLDDLPDDDDGRIEWLHRHWCEIDRWIDERTRARSE